MAEAITCSDQADYGAFVPSQLDDYGLDPWEFRAYCHVVRRAGSAGECWESHEKMAAHCRMSPNKMRSALDVLVAAQVLRRDPPRDGRATYTYVRLHHSAWVDPEKLPSIREAKTSHRKDRRRPRAELASTGSATPIGSDTPAGSDRATPAGSDRTTPAGSDRATPAGSDGQRYSLEGNPSEGNPIKGIPPNPPKGGTRAQGDEDLGSEEVLQQADEPHPVNRDASESPTPSGGEKTSRRRRKKKGDVSLLREEQFEALLGWCKRTIYDRHAPGRFGDRREAKARFAELEESDFLGHGYEVFRQGIIAFSRGLDLNPNQGVPDIERLILSRQRRTPYWEAAYMLQEGLIPEDSAEAFAPLNATSSAASYRRSDESVDAELRQNYLPQLTPEQRISLLDGMFGCTAYYDLNEVQRRELLAYFQQSAPQQQQEVVYA